MTTRTSDDAERRRLWREVLLRLTSLYLLPLVLLSVFFHLEFRTLSRETRRVHLVAMAEQQAATLDLFLSERLINLSNLIDAPAFPEAPTDAFLRDALASLQQTSDAFVELGVLGYDGRLTAYAGPLPALEARSYAEEPWFVALREGAESSIITDIYLGFRGQPHFTIAVKRSGEGRDRVLRAVLSPDRIYEEIASRSSDDSLRSALVNTGGVYQVVSPELARPLARSPFRPPRSPRAGTSSTTEDEGMDLYGYAWLNTSPWAVVSYGGTEGAGGGPGGGLYRSLVIFTAVFFLFGGVTIWLHARSSVRRIWGARVKQRELSGQLVQAAKLASVGELAAGIAHEINNPLAIVAEETGLLMDMMDPELGGGSADEDIRPHLETINAAVFRARDITRKLLGFVRQKAVRLEEARVHDIVNDVADGLLGHELELANVSIVKEYCEEDPVVTTDGNQLAQVFLNLMKNAVDAMSGSGTLTIRTVCRERLVEVHVSDNGCGMDRERLDKIFVPFFTTKDPGKGTGLGLSVSQGIVHSLGGELFVDSEPGVGSTFIVQLPLGEDGGRGASSGL